LSRDQDALLDILEMIELIREHGPKNETALRDDVVRQAATIRWIEIIGEAANRVSDELRVKHPDVPWASMIGMRNVVVHGYDRVRLDIVWKVVSEDLPRLEWQIKTILKELE
jgi:uncharacterized protein with HEPN domain